MTGDCLFECPPYLIEFMLAPDERGEAALSGNIEMTAQRPGCDDFVHVDRFGDSFDFLWPQTAQLEITFDQTARIFADYDAVRRRNALHPRRQIDHVTNR
jgi:hypothetical protein